MGKKKTAYELLILFDRFKGFSIPELHEKLPHYSERTLYRYHDIYSKAVRKANELGAKLK